MPTIEDVDFLISYNGYAEDMRNYMSVNRTAWTCKELWFPYGANLLYGPKKKSRIQRICEKMTPYSWINYIDALLESYNPLIRVNELIALGGNPDIKDTDGFTPLLICARNGWRNHIHMIKFLLDAGVKINTKSNSGFSALYLACFNGHLAIAKELIGRGANIHSLDIWDKTPIHAAVQNGHLDIVNLLLEKGAVLNSTVMLSAIIGNKPSMIKYLKKLDCDMPETPLFYTLKNKNYGLVKTLVKCGANPNELYQGLPVLQRYIKDDAAVIALCQVGANVNIAPLICRVVSKEERNLNIIKTLCKYGANLNVQDLDGLTPLHIAIDDATPGDKDDLVIIKELLKNPIDFTMMDNFGETALEIAKSKCATEIICEIKKAMMRKKLK